MHTQNLGGAGRKQEGEVLNRISVKSPSRKVGVIEMKVLGSARGKTQNPNVPRPTFLIFSRTWVWKQAPAVSACGRQRHEFKTSQNYIHTREPASQAKAREWGCRQNICLGIKALAPITSSIKPFPRYVWTGACDLHAACPRLAGSLPGCCGRR